MQVNKSLTYSQIANNIKQYNHGEEKSDNKESCQGG